MSRRTICSSALAEVFNPDLFSADAAQNTAPAINLLSGMACVFSTPAFNSWLWGFRGQARFPWASHRFFDDVRRRLFSALHPFLHYLPASQYGFPGLGTACDGAAERMADDAGLDRPSFFGAQLEFEPGANPQRLITEWLGLFTTISLPCIPARHKNLVGTLHTLSDAALLRRTVDEPTGHAGYEAMLAELDEDWLINGYYFGLLGSDSATIRKGLRVGQHILFRDECEAYLSLGHEIPAAEGWHESDLPPLDLEAPIYPAGRLAAPDKPYIIVHYGAPDEVLMEPGYVAAAIQQPRQRLIA